MQQFEKVSFYIIPHADDWQLFMQPNAHADLVSEKCKTVFIVTTAGDAGKEENYWRAREEGFKSSIRFCLAHLGVITALTGSNSFNGHPVHYWQIGTVTAFFLRLPDGNLDGSGFAVNNFDSLCKLKSGEISTINSLDYTASYNSWLDFVASIEWIISLESREITNVWINYLNPDINENPGDHSDHLITGQAIQASAALQNFHQLLFTGYGVGVSRKNLSATDLFWKTGMFAAYEQKVYELSGYSTLREGPGIYINWCCIGAKYTPVSP